MARKVSMLAPFEALTGNLSGKQVLKYANNNNPAWDAPDGQQYARNYTPRYIGFKRSKTGLVSFSVKTKTATLLNTASRRRMAAMAATRSFFDSTYGWGIPLTKLTQFQQNFQKAHESDPSLTQYKFAYKSIYQALVNQSPNIIIDGPISPTVVGNPYFKNAVTPMEVRDDATWAKFFPQLAPDAIKFTVGSLTGAAHSGDDFLTLINSDPSYNTLNLTVQTATQYQGFVMRGGLYLCYDVEEGGEVTKFSPQGGESVVANRVYYLDVTPGENGG